MFLAVLQNLANFRNWSFCRWRLLCLILWMLPFKRMKNHKLIIIFWLNVLGWWIKKGLYLEPSPLNHAKYFLKNFSMTISWSSDPMKWLTFQKIYSKIFCTLCVNIWRWIDFYYKKLNISRTEEHDLLWNNKLCNLYLKNCIFRIYILVEVAFKNPKAQQLSPG